MIMKNKILCIDDEKIVLDSLKKEFKKYFDTDYILEFAESGEEGIELARNSHDSNQDIQVIITDFMMPGMKGDEVLMKLNEYYPNSKKILLTGQASKENIIHIINNDCLYRFIDKPWDSLDLNLTLKEAISAYNKEKNLAEKRIELENAYKKLTKLDTSKSYFLSLLSHELLTPLVGIKGNTELIKLFTTNPEILESCEEIMKSEARLRGFSEIALLITRLNINQYKMNITEEPIYSIIESSIGYLDNKIKEKSMEVRVNHYDKDFIIKSDFGLITKAISMIIDNAINHTPAGKNIIIETDKNKIMTSDEGSGIPEEKLATIFNLFESDKLLTHSEGYGLGLTATKLIMDTLNGKLIVENVPNSGVKVTMVL